MECENCGQPVRAWEDDGDGNHEKCPTNNKVVASSDKVVAQTGIPPVANPRPYLPRVATDDLDSAVLVESDFEVLKEIETPIGKIAVQPKVKEVKATGNYQLTEQQMMNIQFLSNGLILEGLAVNALAVLKRWPDKGLDGIKAGKKPTEVSTHNYLQSKEYIRAMALRGVSANPDAISAQQTAVLIEVTTGMGGLDAKLKKLGITKAQWNNWMRQKAFSEQYNKLSRDALQHAIPQAKAQVASKASNGDMKAIQYLMEMTGEYNPNYQAAVDAQEFVVMVIDVLVENLAQDHPELLERINTQLSFKAKALKGISA